jgi:hypothetical protein
MYILEKGLSYQRLILVVQEKLNCPILETGLSCFREFKPHDRTSPFTIFLPSLSLFLKNNYEGDPKTPIGDSLVPPRNLRVLG